jgi:hypothetical protein
MSKEALAKRLSSLTRLATLLSLILPLNLLGVPSAPAEHHSCDHKPVTHPPLPIRDSNVFILLLENHSYAQVIGNSSMPYLNALATSYAYSKAYYANTHPSIGNYIELTAGQVVTNNDTYTATISVDNVVRHLIAAGKTWKEYSEAIPSLGYTGLDAGSYTEHHNPLSYYSDVRNSSTQLQNLVPFTQLATDLANHALPTYSFIVPDNADNGHDCPTGIPNCTDNQNLAHVDSWLQANIQPLLSSSDFNAPHGGLLIIVFDEGVDNVNGGGQVPWIVVGPDVKRGYSSTTVYQHPSTLRFMLSTLGLTTFPGAAATAPDMTEFLNEQTLGVSPNH